MSRRQWVNDSGFTLAETLIAVAILAGALLSLAQVLTTATAVVTTARHLTDGSILATQKLEELRSVVSGSPSVLDVQNGRELIDRVGVAVAAGAGARTEVAYTRQWSIRPLASDPDHVSVIRVMVTPGAVRDGRADSIPRRADEVVLVTMQARHTP